MDPLFERRELVRNIHVEARFLQRNIAASLLAQLRMKYEGICVAEGYIQRRSINIVEHSLGRTNLIKGGLDYTVRFQADICMPHTGQVFRAPVVLKSKIGIHAEVTPIKVLLPRDIHIGNAEFDEIAEKQDIEFEVVGSRFQQGDESIVVLGKLRETVKPVVESSFSAGESSSSEPIIAAPIGDANKGTSEEKRMVTVNVESVKPQEVRRKRLRIPASGESKNESESKGTS
jgi:DNA-directed RNA polymerase subunit E'/Rpb7